MLPSKINLFLTCAFGVRGVMTTYIPYLNPGFFFDLHQSGESRPIPVTEQCGRLRMTWRSIARGVTPTPPFYAQVFASSSITPFLIQVGDNSTFDWDVPFAPGTQYQICMYDRHGVSGGCQAMYTVIKNSTSKYPDCRDMAAPFGLGVIVTKPDGPRAQYGFIEQCTDMTVTPTSGKPPFMLTVAPSLHPPFNITSNSMSPITWAVSLSRGSSFFVALSSSDGQMWSMGPMHAGGPGRSDCFAPEPPTKVASIALGTGICGITIGACLGLLCAHFAVRYRHRRRIRTSAILEKDIPSGETDAGATHPLPLLPGSSSHNSHFNSGIGPFSAPRPESITVEPFTVGPSPGHVTGGGKDCIGRRQWKGLVFATLNSSRRNLPPNLHVTTRSPAPVTHESVERLSSAPSYSITPDTDNVGDLPPRYMVNP